MVTSLVHSQFAGRYLLPWWHLGSQPFWQGTVNLDDYDDERGLSFNNVYQQSSTRMRVGPGKSRPRRAALRSGCSLVQPKSEGLDCCSNMPLQLALLTGLNVARIIWCQNVQGKDINSKPKLTIYHKHVHFEKWTWTPRLVNSLRRTPYSITYIAMQRRPVCAEVKPSPCKNVPWTSQYMDWYVFYLHRWIDSRQIEDSFSGER